ncbi:MAG TPA: hypothetical protein PLT68_07255 [Actinomycetota bacterium]|nr:hypothetical protein [Actinomycetota bacterium]
MDVMRTAAALFAMLVAGVVAASPATASVVPAAVPDSVASMAQTVAPAAKKKRGSLTVVAQGVPAGRSAKIMVAGKGLRKKLPPAGKLRNLRPGTYRVWASPIVSDGGIAAVADLPLRVKVNKRKSAVVHLHYSWNPKTDSYPPGSATDLRVTVRTPETLSLRWVNGQAPDLQSVEVRRRQGSQAPQTLDEGKFVAVDQFATSVADSDLSPRTVYSYSVFMLDDAGNASTPASVTTRTTGDAESITAGTHHTCALLSPEPATDETPDDQAELVECWGDNTHGQIGDGRTDDALAPTPVALPGVVQVVAGAEHTCARVRGGKVWCWGRNDSGQLGQGTTTDARTPVPVNLPAVADLAAGGDHTCAVLTTGSVRCWGRNDHGQLGIKASGAELLPVAVAGLSNVTGITAGTAHTCAVLSGGSVRCWGGNGNGQLGDSTRADSSSPVRPGVGPVRSLTAGVFHTCAVLTDQSISCWGGNSYGQVGDGTTTDRLTPVSVMPTGASMATAGAYHTCALTSSGVVRCWGRNTGGRLGDGTTTDRWVPTRVNGLANASAVAAGGYHSCAVTAVGVRCWGSNASGQLGQGNRNSSSRPVQVAGL